MLLSKVEAPRAEAQSLSVLPAKKRVGLYSNSSHTLYVHHHHDHKAHSHGHGHKHDAHHSHHHHHQQQDGCAGRCSFWNLNCSCSFTVIPDELLVCNIFTFLDVDDLCRQMAVCSRWHFLSSDHSLWRRIDLSKFFKTMSEAAAGSLLSRFGYHAQVVKLCGFRLTGAALAGVGGPQLEELHLCSNSTVQDQAVATVVARSPNLRLLFLGGCQEVTSGTVRRIADTCKRFEQLSLRGCNGVTDDALEHLGGASLVEINLRRCRRLTGSAVRHLAANCPNLEAVDLRGVAVDDDAVSQLARSLTRLKRLDIGSANPFGGNARLTDAALLEVGEHCPGLQDLRLSGSSHVTDVGLLRVAEGCPAVTALDIGGCSNVTSAAVVQLSRRWSGLNFLTLFQCLNVDDDAVAALAANNSRLEHLDLQGCSRVTERSLAHFLEGFPALKHLNLSGCSGLTQEQLDLVQSRRPNLQLVRW